MKRILGHHGSYQGWAHQGEKLFLAQKDIQAIQIIIIITEKRIISKYRSISI